MYLSTFIFEFLVFNMFSLGLDPWAERLALGRI
jgi:hypothetical protein